MLPIKTTPMTVNMTVTGARMLMVCSAMIAGAGALVGCNGGSGAGAGSGGTGLVGVMTGTGGAPSGDDAGPPDDAEGSGGAPGGFGSGGSGTGGSGPRDGAVCTMMCPDLVCPAGQSYDGDGCPLCVCNPVCPPIDCGTVDCPFGFTVNNDGCETCSCNTAPTCPTLPCQQLSCPYGVVAGADGCPTCQCKAAPPAAACSGKADQATCNAEIGCRWLAPGCTEPSLPMGCYERSAIACTSDAVCGTGKRCAERWINPCFGSICAACASQITVCL